MIEDLMGPGIQGEDARPDGISSLVNQVDTVAVARDPDARDLARVYPGAFEGFADGALTVLPDLIHVLFDPAGVGAQVHVVGGSLAHLAALLVEDDRLGDRQSAVDT